MKVTRVLGTVAAVCFAGAAMAQGTTPEASPLRFARRDHPLPEASLLVLSKKDHTLAIVDPATLKVIARVPVGDDPHEVIASADGRTAFVSNYGFGAFHTLAVVDLVWHGPRPQVELGAMGGAHGLAFAGGEVWFTSEFAKAFGRYDPASGKVDLVMGLGQNRPHMIHVSPDGQHVVVTNTISGTVSLVDREEMTMPGPPPPGAGGPLPPPPGAGPTPPQPKPRMDWNETLVKVGGGSEGFDPSPDGREIWVGNAKDGTVSVIDRASKTVTATLQANVRSVNRLKFTPDGSRVLLSLLDGGGVVVMDAKTRTEVKRIDLGRGVAGILMEPGGRRAFVSCGGGGYVAVIDLATMAVVGKIDAGGEPDGLAWAERQ